MGEAMYLVSGTKQEIFDRVVAHLRQQGRPAREGSWCRYLTADGLKCAVGALIPDGHPAQTDLDGDPTPQILAERYPNLFEPHLVEGGPWGLLRQLQKAHDEATGANWLAVVEQQLVDVASQFGLHYTPPAA